MNGATIGLPLGALRLPGCIRASKPLTSAWPARTAGRGNQAGGLAAPAVAQAVPFLFVPGWNFFGATYAMGVVQAFYMFDVLAAPGN